MTKDDRSWIYLASASPRRAELLAQLGIRCDIRPADIDETVRAQEAPDAYVERVAREKGRAALARVTGDAPVLAADTAVVIDGCILGKPAGADEAAAMLARLSGRVHDVWSAVCVLDAERSALATSRTEVRFRAVSATEAAAYWRSGEPAGKAGGYAIQGRGAVFIEEIRGSYSGVMGLPLFETARLLAGFGYRSLN